MNLLPLSSHRDFFLVSRLIKTQGGFRFLILLGVTRIALAVCGCGIAFRLRSAASDFRRDLFFKVARFAPPHLAAIFLVVR